MPQHRFKYQAELIDKPFFITVDPGARADGGTGIVLWYTLEDKPIYIEFAKGYSEHYEFRVQEIIKTIRRNVISALIHRTIDYRTVNHIFPSVSAQEYLTDKPIPVFIERPRYFDNVRGELSAKSDSLFKLIFCYGCLFQYFTLCPYTYAVPMQIAHWKGQLSDTQVKTRIHEICNYTPEKKLQKSDVYAALGIGFWIKGLF